MDLKPTFINRQNSLQNRQPFDALKIINRFLALHPSNRIIVNSPLYLAAVKQYNTNIQNTLIRPPIPSWFCGKIDSSTNQLITSPTDAEQRVSSGVTTAGTPNIAQTPFQQQNFYTPDACLEVGTPGSTGYVSCQSSNLLDEDDRATSGIDWQPTNISSGCTSVLYLIENTVGHNLTMMAWEQTKQVMRNQNIGYHQKTWGGLFQGVHDLWYSSSQTAGEPGPMSLVGKTCTKIDPETTQIVFLFQWQWHTHMGQIRTSVNVTSIEPTVIENTWTATEV
jgi:hypothetical protein